MSGSKLPGRPAYWSVGCGVALLLFALMASKDFAAGNLERAYALSVVAAALLMGVMFFGAQAFGPE